ncbi:hypothetical protein [Clostridium sp. ZS2-4]|uniref:hypothetical protein n=1 Tax=Clostridium sp. ZS2-4 TaxID=2987703 RepID=UPI00227B6715|nr:hypothetical protein [Clostridium sp. ZS2-4]MCY6355360.1 hypothetical protein [Clostridium sp. ZS2-4]
MHNGNIKSLKKLKERGLIYYEPDNLESDVEINYQLQIALLDSVNTVIMTEDQYNILKENRDELILEIGRRSFDEEDWVSDDELEFRCDLIEKYFNIDDPIELGMGIYFFRTNKEKKKELFKMARQQIREGKFENKIFKEQFLEF